ncbi:hypothetical protein LV779_24375 [Streptomyces thinghirensis]|nr:hypothetical protein [Streptomyces thinghirensis]
MSGTAKNRGRPLRRPPRTAAARRCAARRERRPRLAAPAGTTCVSWAASNLADRAPGRRGAGGDRDLRRRQRATV